MNPFLRRAVIVLALATAVGGLGAYWWLRGVPVALPDAPSDHLQCLSYSPYRVPGETPHDPTFTVSRARVVTDLTALAAHTDCVRTYSVQQGLAVVPEVAAKLGLKVMLGIWIGRNAAENQAEIRLALDAIRRNPQAVSAVIVGNEVLLRREQPPERLAALIDEVRAATKVPVTYADVWEFWLANPALAQSVDFVTVHMLPYWEDDPVPVGQSVEHALRMRDRVQAVFPGKEIVIGEAGWPSAGRRRRGAVPSLVNEARFVREFARAAQARGIRYNIIEAFDQPWKRGQEGAMGGVWGVYDGAGEPKFPLRGPVVEDPRWMRGPAAMLLGAALFALVGWRRRTQGATGWLIVVLAGAATGGGVAAQWQYMVEANRSLIEWAATGGYTVAGLAVSLLVATTLARGAAGTPPAPLATWWMLRTGQPGGDRTLGALRALFLFGAAVMNLLLVFDARYRDFPLALHAVPAVGFALLAMLRRPTAGLEERFLAGWLAVSAPVIVWHEGVENVDALAWAAVSLVYAVPLLAGARARASTSVPSAKPTAAGS